MSAELLAIGEHRASLMQDYEFPADRYSGLAEGDPLSTTIGWTMAGFQTSALLKALGLQDRDAVVKSRLTRADLDRIDLDALDALSEQAACAGLGRRMKRFLEEGFHVWIRVDR